MTALEVTILEESLGLTLPEEYKNVVMNHPFAGMNTAGYELCDDVEAILGENRYARDHGFFRQDWPTDWFIIGTDGCGGDYFITTTPFDGRVYFADQQHKLPFGNLSLCRSSAAPMPLWMSSLIFCGKLRMRSVTHGGEMTDVRLIASGGNSGYRRGKSGLPIQ